MKNLTLQLKAGIISTIIVASLFTYMLLTYGFTSFY